MCNAKGAGAAVTGVVGGIFGGHEAQDEATARNKAIRYNAWLKEEEAKFSQRQAKEAIEIGKQEEAQFRQELEGIKGEQRTGFAASGVVVDTGSALDTLLDTAQFGEIDAQTIRRNAEQEAWTFRQNARAAYAEREHLLSQKTDPVGEFRKGFAKGFFGGFGGAGGFSSIIEASSGGSSNRSFSRSVAPRSRRFVHA